MTREDVLAIRAYLDMVEPVHNAVQVEPAALPVRSCARAMVGWNALYFKPGDFEPIAGKSAEWNRGAYLVEGLGIAACATRRRTRWAATRTAARCRAARCKAGLRRT